MKVRPVEMSSLFSMVILLSALPGCALHAAGVKAEAATRAAVKWPEGCDPKTVGERIATNLLARPDAKKAIAYPEVCTAYGSIRLAASVGDKALVDKLIAKYASILTDNGKHLIPRPDHVDRSVFGVLPLEIYGQTHDARYLALGKNSADAQWAKTNAAGLTSQTRWWLDDMFMITALQTQAFRETKDAVYLDRAAKEMAAYVDKLQQPSGLFFHSSGPGLFYWGRANGWMAAGMAELLSELPPEHPERAKILEGYRKFMTALVKVQDSDGMWHQVLDDPKAWPESSCSGMFTFALARGVHNGWLDAGTFGEPVRKAWLALSTNYVDANGNVKEVCVGTGRGTNEDFYLQRPRALGDPHGQAAVVWAAWAMLDFQAAP